MSLDNTQRPTDQEAPELEPVAVTQDEEGSDVEGHIMKIRCAAGAAGELVTRAAMVRAPHGTARAT